MKWQIICTFLKRVKYTNSQLASITSPKSCCVYLTSPNVITHVKNATLAADLAWWRVLVGFHVCDMHVSKVEEQPRGKIISIAPSLSRFPIHNPPTYKVVQRRGGEGTST